MDKQKKRVHIKQFRRSLLKFTKMLDYDDCLINEGDIQLFELWKKKKKKRKKTNEI